MKLAEAGEWIATALVGQHSACVTCSFQAEAMVLLSILRESVPDIPVLFIDTGYHFQEVYRYRDEMTARYKLNLVNLRPAQTVRQQESQFGILHQSQPDLCCRLRKVEPLFRALESYDVWFAGLRRAQSPTRANLQVFDRFLLPSGKQLLKVSPLADWTDQEIWKFAREREIPLLPLYDAGYASVGCEPCTAVPTDPNNLRSGRWAGRKLECGIHLAEVR
ncbi:MAG: phosphoadenylyl-sulfate reductase [Acidobacteriaceae bacterium]|nr:phosphoadenylyl-sulfate reductase [Acidobacteriaceae bacterium]MBV9766255.1 phosphoadenylyl-sulfate reductase [Acidobacteriaceae bacterium]